MQIPAVEKFQQKLGLEQIQIMNEQHHPDPEKSTAGLKSNADRNQGDWKDVLVCSSLRMTENSLFDCLLKYDLSLIFFPSHCTESHWNAVQFRTYIHIKMSSHSNKRTKQKGIRSPILSVKLKWHIDLL